MEWLMNHITRILAAALLVLFALVATETIGTTGQCEPFTWRQAWMSVAVIAAVMFAGFVAGRESKS